MKAKINEQALWIWANELNDRESKLHVTEASRHEIVPLISKEKQSKCIGELLSTLLPSYVNKKRNSPNEDVPKKKMFIPFQLALCKSPSFIRSFYLRHIYNTSTTYHTSDNNILRTKYV